jgi:hypothetical protein
VRERERERERERFSGDGELGGSLRCEQRVSSNGELEVRAARI